jgi:phospholipase C
MEEYMRFNHLRFGLAALIAAAFVVAVATPRVKADDGDVATKTPIKHLVVIFQENVSFDHYFATYPHAKPNNDKSVYFGEPKDDTPHANTLESAGLLTNNPNGVNPFRIDRSRPVTCDEDHVYADEQYVFDGGLMDRFTSTLPYTNPPNKAFSCNDTAASSPLGTPLGPNSVMGYYDGNTITALWNYAQHFAMSDNFFGTTFGPSTPGLLNLLAGNTYPATITHINTTPGANNTGSVSNGAATVGAVGAVVGDPQPDGDICNSATRVWINMGGQSIGDLLSAAHLTWGSFMGGFNSCSASHSNVAGAVVTDYIPHHSFTQYWSSTRNASHVPPSSTSMIGMDDAAHHEYDLSAFFTALSNGHLPAVSFLKAPAYQDGHPGYSDPLDEQKFLVDTLNTLQHSKEWKETAVIITYDDSDGWYDHVMGPIVNQSNVLEDRLLLDAAGHNNCGTAKALPGDGIQNGRCGYGPRFPFLVISPWAKVNYIDHRVIDQSSITRFIEDNWSVPRIGGGSTDAIAGTINGLFDFDDWDKDHDYRREHDERRRGDDDEARKLFLNDLTGTIVNK